MIATVGFKCTIWARDFLLLLSGSKVENKQLLVDKFIPKVTSAVMTTTPTPGAPPDNDTIKAPLV